MIIEVTISNDNIKFFQDSNLIFHGKRIVKNWRYQWLLFDAANNLIASFKHKPFIIWFGWHISYLVNFCDNEFRVDFKTRNGPHYKFEHSNISYLAIIHKGNRVSLFANAKKIGYFEEYKFGVGYQSRFKLLIENSTNLALICTFIYLIKCENESSESFLNFNFGNFGREMKPFDENWKIS